MQNAWNFRTLNIFISQILLKRHASTADVPKKCLYEILNLTQNASQADIKTAFYDLSKIHHPDKNDGSAEAIKRFHEISYAYEVLSNAKTRDQYDSNPSSHINDRPVVTENAAVRYRKPKFQQTRAQAAMHDYVEWEKQNKKEQMRLQGERDPDYERKKAYENFVKYGTGTPDLNDNGSVNRVIYSFIAILAILLGIGFFLNDSDEIDRETNIKDRPR